MKTGDQVLYKGVRHWVISVWEDGASDSLDQAGYRRQTFLHHPANGLQRTAGLPCQPGVGHACRPADATGGPSRLAD